MRDLFHSKILLFILLFAFILRTIFLGEIPPGITHDELNDILNAQSIIKTGRLIPGVSSGIIGIPQGDYQSAILGELGSYLLLPWIFFFGISWPIIKLPYVFTSLGLLILIYLITKKITNNNLAVISAYLLAINPWAIHFGRTAYESNFSYFFYLLAVYLILSLKSWQVLWVLPPMLIGFLSYFAPKAQILPLALYSSLFAKIYHPKISFRPLLLLNILVLLFFVTYMILLFQHPAGQRIGETRFSTEFTSVVNIKRTASLNFPLTTFFENKLSENLMGRMAAYIEGLSPKMLFLEGQKGDTDALTIPDHGFLYLIDLPLAALGLIYLSRFYLKALLMLSGLITIALIPNFINTQGTTYGLRSGLMFPLLVVFAASGFYYFLKLIRQVRFSFILVISFVLLYHLFFFNFIYQYFVRLPVERFEGWYAHQRVLAKYLDLVNNGKEKINVVVPDQKDASFQYLYFAKKYTTLDQIQQANLSLLNKSYQFGDIKFTSACPLAKEVNNNEVFIIDSRLNCQLPGKTVIASPKDAGSKYTIINDQICQKINKNRYPLVKQTKQLAIEHQSLNNFCINWITDPSLN